ncbi:MAG TPA: FHA domain-containing protein [Verrucomicrobiae bacterium]
MIEVHILSGKMAGNQAVARRFPFHIGRRGSAELVLDEAGVWEDHACLELRRPDGFCLTALGEALVAVNDQPIRSALLRNGDRIRIGSVQLQFWLASVRQRGLALLELGAWGSMAGVTLGQVGLLYHLLR